MLYTASDGTGFRLRLTDGTIICQAQISASILDSYIERVKNFEHVLIDN